MSRPVGFRLDDDILARVEAFRAHLQSTTPVRVTTTDAIVLLLVAGLGVLVPDDGAKA